MIRKEKGKIRKKEQIVSELDLAYVQFLTVLFKRCVTVVKLLNPFKLQFVENIMCYKNIYKNSVR